MSYEFKGTPGKWCLNAYTAHVMPEGQSYTPVEDGIPICAMLWPTSLRSEQETRANARAIAAVPELIWALNRVARLNPNAGEIGEGMLRTIVEDARAALAKATGENQ